MQPKKDISIKASNAPVSQSALSQAFFASTVQLPSRLFTHFTQHGDAYAKDNPHKDYRRKIFRGPGNKCAFFSFDGLCKHGRITFGVREAWTELWPGGADGSCV
jgi:hypothetical protein